VAACVVCSLAAGLRAADTDSLACVKFDGKEQIEFLRSGTLSADGEGLTGAAGDKCYKGTVANWKSGKSGACARVANLTAFVDIKELTITAWYKLNSPSRNSMTLLECGVAMLMWDEGSGQWVLRLVVSMADPDMLNVRYWCYSGRDNNKLRAWSRVGDWIFLAVTWKQSESRTKFYQGSKTDAIVPRADRTRQDDVLPLSTKKPPILTIGNGGGSNGRPMDACIDNVRIFRRALSSDEIEQIRASDIKPEN